MAVRSAVLVGMASILTLVLLTRSTPDSAHAQHPTQEPSRAAHVATPPPMFSAWYVEALRDNLTLEDADAVRLEQWLAANPEDLRARLQLMAFHQRGDRMGREEERAKRLRHTLWLI